MKNKFSLFAPPDYWELTPDQRKSLCNGCGTKGICGYIVPDRILGCNITQACDIHDYMYEVGRDIEDKKEADRVFLNNMLRTIEAKGGFKVVQRMRARFARRYYDMVVIFGGPAFWKGKNKPEELAYFTS